MFSLQRSELAEQFAQKNVKRQVENLQQPLLCGLPEVEHPCWFYKLPAEVRKKLQSD